MERGKKKPRLPRVSFNVVLKAQILLGEDLPCASEKQKIFEQVSSWCGVSMFVQFVLSTVRKTHQKRKKKDLFSPFYQQKGAEEPNRKLAIYYQKKRRY
jgi:hypothetical protein